MARSLVNAYGLNGRCADALELFRRVPAPLIGESAYISALNACSHAGYIQEARSLFDKSETKSERVYGAMVSH